MAGERAAGVDLTIGNERTSPGEVIFELTRNGPYLKCSAIHVTSGLEVSTFGPATEPEGLKRIALAKLQRALTRS